MIDRPHSLLAYNVGAHAGPIGYRHIGDLINHSARERMQYSVGRNPQRV